MVQFNGIITFSPSQLGVPPILGVPPTFEVFVMIPLPDKSYDILYADPPWEYKIDRTNAPNPGGSAARHYPLMSVQELVALPVRNIVNDDCLLFIWATFPVLEKAFPVIRAWGFEYITCAFTWIKKTENNKLHIGVGNVTRSNPELVLLGKRGKRTYKEWIKTNIAISNVVFDKIGRHSAKPQSVRRNIEVLFGDRSRIELFARSKNVGWDIWGNEVVDGCMSSVDMLEF